MIFRYYKDVTLFNLCFSLLVGMISPYAGCMTFGTFGNLIGILCYNTFFKEQYYFYFNRGISKRKLHLFLFKVNAPIGIPFGLWIYFGS